MTTTNEIWGPERLKRINSDPALLSLLYDLNLLPEVVLAHIRAAREEERERCAKVAEATWRKGELLVECHYKAGWHSSSREIADGIRKGS